MPNQFPRRHWLLFIIGVIANAALAQAEPIRLENAYCLVEIEPAHGLITRIDSKVTGLVLLSEPRLANNFRFTVPLPGHGSNIEAVEGNTILGRDQTLDGAERAGNRLTLHWDGPLKSEQGEDYNLDATMQIELAGPAVCFRLSIRNRTPYKIGELWYPMLGGMTGLGKDMAERNETRLAVPTTTGTQIEEIFRKFINSSIYAFLGTPVPERYFAYPSFLPVMPINWASKTVMPQAWAELTAPGRQEGVYVGVHDPLTRFKVMDLQLYPAAAAGRTGGDWPRAGEFGDVPIGMVLNWVHFPYTVPLATYDGPPVVVQFHEGGWREAARIYQSWLDSVAPAANAEKNWLRQQSAIQETQGVRFTDLPRLARDARAFGVTVLLVNGWKAGGDEDGNPRYEPDPQLGDWEALKAAVKACHEHDVRVLFNINIQPVAAQSEMVRNGLEKFACRGPWNNFYTPDRGRSVWLEPAFPEFRRLIVDQVKRLAEAGADGVHMRRLLTAQVDFHPRLEMGPDRASWEGTLRLVKELTEACRAIKPAFAVSTGNLWDRLEGYVDAVLPEAIGPVEYVQIVPALQPALPPPNLGMPAKPADASELKQLFPAWSPSVAISRGDQFDLVNEAVRCGGRLRVTAALRHETMQELAPYLREVQRIREALADCIFLGEFRDGADARVEGAVAWGVWREPRTDRRACVLVNRGSKPVEATLAGWEGRAPARVRVHEPFQGNRTAELPLRVEIPPQRLVVVAED